MSPLSVCLSLSLCDTHTHTHINTFSINFSLMLFPMPASTYCPIFAICQLECLCFLFSFLHISTILCVSLPFPPSTFFNCTFFVFIFSSFLIGVGLSVFHCLTLSLSLCLPAFLPACLSVCLFGSLSVFLSLSILLLLLLLLLL